MLGAEHPNTAASLITLASVYAYQGDFAAAIPLIERALQIQERVLGPNHPDTQQTQQGLANMRQAANQRSTPADPRDPFPLLTAIAQIALGDDSQRSAVEQSLAQLEQNGWMLRALVARIWQGERDRSSLTHGLDEQDTALIERILELIAQAEKPQEGFFTRITRWFGRR